MIGGPTASAGSHWLPSVFRFLSGAVRQWIPRPGGGGAFLTVRQIDPLG